MNETELVAAVAERAEISKKDVEAALKVFTETIRQELVKGEKIQLVGFGTFEISGRPTREGRNPGMGESVKITAIETPEFRAGRALKGIVNA